MLKINFADCLNHRSHFFSCNRKKVHTKRGQNLYLKRFFRWRVKRGATHLKKCLFVVLSLISKILGLSAISLTFPVLFMFIFNGIFYVLVSVFRRSFVNKSKQNYAPHLFAAFLLKVLINRRRCQFASSVNN